MALLRCCGICVLRDGGRRRAGWFCLRFLFGGMASTGADDEKRRALLFGARTDTNAYRRSSAAPRPGAPRPNGAPPPYAAAEQEMMEQSNSEKVDGLRGQVGQMRHVRCVRFSLVCASFGAPVAGEGGAVDLTYFFTLVAKLALDIGAEVREQNALLDGVGGTFDEGGDALRRTIREVQRLAASRSGGHMCVLFLFAFAFFVLIYLLLRR